MHLLFQMIQFKSINLSIFLITFICQCANREIKKGSQNSGDSVSMLSKEALANKPEKMEQSKKTLVIQGIFDSSGNALVKIVKPTLYNRSLSRPTPDQSQGRYMVLINFDRGDSLKVYFDALVSGDRENDTARHGFWEVQIPVKDEKIRIVKIIEAKTRKLFAEFKNEDIIGN
jgi:hypothetical protein